jgi:hypothetical protein
MTARSRARFDDTIMLARDTVGKNPRQKNFKFVFEKNLLWKCACSLPRISTKTIFACVDLHGPFFGAAIVEIFGE